MPAQQMCCHADLYITDHRYLHPDRRFTYEKTDSPEKKAHREENHKGIPERLEEPIQLVPLFRNNGIGFFLSRINWV